MTTIGIALDDGLLIARERAGSWAAEQQLSGRAAQCLAADPLRPEVLFCGTFGHGLWRSGNAGATWQEAGAGIAHAAIMAVAISAAERSGNIGVTYVGTEPSALFRSEDDGASWHECAALQALPSKATWSYPPRPYTHHVRCIGLDPHNANLYVCLENGALVRSLDGGRTFVDRTPDSPTDTHTLLMHPDAPGRLYAAAGDGFSSPGSGYCESTDNGTSWQRPDAGITWHYGWGLAVDSGDPNRMLLSTAPSPNQAHNPANAESTIYQGTGGAWREVRAGLPASRGMLASALAAHPTQPGVFFAANNLGLFHSWDGGEMWERVAIPWPQHYRWKHLQALLVTV